MNDDKKRLRDTAVMYEGILSKIPNDKYSLKELINIYEKINDVACLEYCQSCLEKAERGETYLFKLPNSSEETLDKEPVGRVVHRVRQAPKARVQLQERPSVADPMPLQWNRQKTGAKKAVLDWYSHEFSIKPHVDMLIKLYSVDLLNSEQFSYVMKKLAAQQFDADAQRVFSIFGFIERFRYVNMDMIYYFMMKKSLIPYVDLSLYEKDEQLYELLPKSFVFNEGVVIFKKISQAYCIALLNPLNLLLMQKIVEVLDAPVHYYFSSAREFDIFLYK